MQIRLATTDDADAIAAIYAPFVTDSTISFETDPPDGAQMATRIEARLPRYPWLVADENDSVIGYAYAGAHRERAAYAWSTEVSVYVAETARRRGVARRLYQTLFDLLDRQGYRMAYAGITLPNPASVGFHEAMGFVPVGVYHNVGWKHGHWRDVGWWELALGDNAPAVPLMTLDELD
ncbi:MAG: arsinothricin resistance N-acetyltransferase ArsN1 family B [Acidimicrobiia bacterium]